MATTTTSYTLNGKPFPYIGLGVASAQYITNIPSAEVVFTKEDTITVAAAGEDQKLVIANVLPRTFCYVLVEAFLRVDGLDAVDWGQACSANLTDSGTQTEDRVSIPLIFENTFLAQNDAVFQRNYVCSPTPTKLIVPRATDDANMNVEIFNNTIDGTVMTMKYYARFLRFDRNQAQYWQVNTPFYTR